MKVRVVSISVLVAVLLFPAISSAQEQVKSLDEFNRDANYHSKTLLLKLLQFSAPYPGFYQQTSLDSNGTAFTARVVPDWAVQNSINAKLNDGVLDQIRQLLAQLKLSATPAAVEPQRGQLHSAFVFYDGQDFLRLNYNGRVPAQIDAILAILNKEFSATEQVRSAEFAAHQKLMRETYGDWQNRAGITINAGTQMHRCKGDGALVVSTSGRRNAVAGSPVAVSVYHALVFYSGAVVTGSGSGGRWSDDPVQSGVVIWTPLYADGVFAEKVLQRKLEILNNAIDATVTISGKTYRLTDGNMFVIRMGADWLPTVTQLKDVFADPATPQASLERFKSILKDPSVQKLELF